MIAESTPDRLNCHTNRSLEVQMVNPETLYCHAIENADGIPFQLMFGSQPGEGYYVSIGSGVRQLLGVKSEDFTEKTFLDMIVEIVPLSEDIPSEMAESRRRFVNGELNSYKAEVLLRLPGGERKWILDSSFPLIDEKTGKVIGAFGILFDINERKQTIENLEKAKQQADESDRLKVAFLRNLSHEIRTPLNAIVGFSSLLSDYESGPEIQQEFTDIIIRSSDHLLSVINDIVEISNIEANAIKINKKAVSLNSALGELHDRFAVKATEKNIFLKYSQENSDKDITIFTDGYKLKHILDSLLANAIKFTEKGMVEMGYSVNGNEIEFYISDTGIGISREHHPLIFNKFFQVESSSTRRYTGSGLGLSISKAYAKLLGGNIRFISEPGKGSVFYLNLPN